MRSRIGRIKKERVQREHNLYKIDRKMWNLNRLAGLEKEHINRLSLKINRLQEEADRLERKRDPKEGIDATM